jgi:DNA helicase-2/ATP-dependent DNA helicase PcrA
MPHNITISDGDIDQISGVMRWQFDDPERREAVACTESRDIQACPGSGKTTMVVAKLMILAEHWRWRERGVCVLSHTNVAREELEKRVADHPSGHLLLHYPHFIGTIQKFVDEFLALPYMRSQGIEVQVLDNDRFGSEAIKRFRWSRFRTARSALGRILPGDGGQSIVAGLRWETADRSLGSAGGAIPVGAHTTTYSQLRSLKILLCQEGYFRFDDMYAYALAYLQEVPAIIAALRLRFPWVFVDEMQDTNATQDQLLRTLFAEGCILQRFGDANQAIYAGEAVRDEESTFPCADPVGVTGSMRFGSTISGFASPLTAVVPQQLTGLRDEAQRSHTVFLFDADTISCVLPAFGELLASQYRGGVPQGYVAKAVGFRKSEPAPGTVRRIPFNVGDYWEHFDSRFTARSARPDSFIEYAMLGRNWVSSQGACCEGYRIVIEAVLQLFRLQGARDATGAGFTKTRLFDALEELGDWHIEEFRALVADLCLPTGELTRPCWREVTERLARLVEPWSDAELTNSADQFLRWEECPEPLEQGGARSSADLSNVYRYDSPVGPIDIEVTTIHAVKGQTHDATLVLETFWFTHDLQEMVPYLSGVGDRTEPSAVRTRERMKRVYVAMTRPRELVCLALHRDHVSADQRAALEECGWSIQDLGA